MNKLQKWQVIASKMVLDHPWCKVRQDKIRLPKNEIIDDYFIFIKPDIAMILPINSQREIIFVRQYRHGAREFFLELPAGRFDPEQEKPEIAALRELEEETGYIAQDIREIGILYDNPSKETNRIHLFISENVVLSGKQNLDITEDIEVILIPVESVLTTIAQGQISVAGTVAALFWGLSLLQ
jgi:8-oxo-dGTP pyrophosphatase MutT (NUDIX family)